MNQVAFITGGSRGIGKAVAIGLLEHGFECALVARESARLEETVTELKKLYPQRSILSFAIDVTDKEAVTTAIHETTKTYNRIDVAFNNAGIFALGSLNIENDSLQQMMDINYFGAINVARPILKQFEKQKSGYLINLASVCGKIGFAGFSGYCASKFALLGLNDSLYHEYAGTGIKVSAICPSFVDTDAVNAFTELPIAREEMIPPEDIAKSVLYLLTLSKNACVKEMVVECLRTPL